MVAKIIKLICVGLGYLIKIAGPTLLDYMKNPKKVLYVKKNKKIHNTIADGIRDRVRKKSDSSESRS